MFPRNHGQEEKEELQVSKTEVSAEAPANTTLVILNDYLSSLEDTDFDAKKVIRCIIYIEENISFIKWAVNNKNNPLYTDLIYAQPDDKVKGVLRDRHNTSFHFNNYNDGEIAANDLRNYNAQLVNYLQIFSPIQKKIFTSKLIYNQATGCLDERTALALNWAAKTTSTNIAQLDDIMQLCRYRYSLNSPNMAFWRYVENFCQEENLTECIYENNNTTISTELLKQYAIILGEDESSCEQKQLPIESSALITELPIADHMTQRESLLEFHFSDADETILFIDLAEKILNKCISEVVIQRCSHTNDQENRCTIISLNKNQVNQLFGNSTYETFSLLNSIDQRVNINHLISLKLALLQHVAVFINYMGNIFHHLIDSANDDEIQAVINRLASPTCNKLAGIKNSRRNNACSFMLLAYKNTLPFVKFMQKIDDKTCRQAAQLKRNDGACAFMSVACYQSANVFNLLLEKLDTDTCNQLTKKHDAYAKNSFMYVALYQDAEGFLAFLKKLTDGVYQQTAFTARDDNGCGIMSVAYSQDAEAFLVYLKRLSDSTCNRVAGLVQTSAYSTVGCIAAYQTSENFNFFIERLDTEVCRQAIKKIANLRYTLSIVAEKQPPESFSLVLEKIGELSLPGDRNTIELTDLMQAVILFQSASNIITFFSLVNGEAREFLLHYFNSTISHQKTRQIILALHSKVGCYHQEKDTSQNKISPAVSALLEDLSNTYTTYLMAHPPIKIGKTAQQLTAAEKHVLHVFQQGDAAIKLVTKTNWPEFKKQLADYNYRPTWRKQKTRTTEHMYKYIHKTKKIIQARTHEEQLSRIKQPRTKAKKTPFTFISKNLHTNLLTEGNRMVGVVCFVNSPKAMLRTNTVTYQRSWVSENKKDVLRYARTMQYHSFTDKEKFKDDINSAASLQNEILLEPSVEGENKVLAIVTSENSHEACRIANKYQQDYLILFNIFLPIIYYDNEYRRICFLPSQAENELHTKLTNLADTLHKLPQQKAWHTMIFSAPQFDFDGLKVKITPHLTEAIALIFETMKSHQVSELEAWQQIKNLAMKSEQEKKSVDYSHASEEKKIQSQKK